MERIIENKNKIFLISVAFTIVCAVALYVLMGISIESVIYLCALSTVAVMALQDIDDHHFSNAYVYLMIAFGLVLLPLNPFVTWLNVLLGVVLLGGGLAGLSTLTKGQIGMGDAKIFAILAVYFGGKSAFMILMYSLVVSALVGLVMIAFRKANRKTEIPFVPFILIGVIVELFMKF